MAVLCDWEIQARCRKGDMVVPFTPELLNPASLDVRLGDYLMIESIYSPELIRIDISDRTEDEPFMLQPGEFAWLKHLSCLTCPTTSAANLYSSQAVQEMALITFSLAGAIQAGTEASSRSN